MEQHRYIWKPWTVGEIIFWTIAHIVFYGGLLALFVLALFLLKRLWLVL